METKKVLIVGAGGFVGGFLADEGLRRGYEVWAGVRSTTSRRYLTDGRLHFLELDFDNPASLPASLSAALSEGEKWDYIIYNLGATKCLSFSDFNTVNYDYLRRFTAALETSGKVPEKFIYASSLSVMGPGDERNYTPFTEKDIPAPNTRYGTSKLKAEMWLKESGLPAIVFRTTGIYGPRDHDYFLMMESIRKGFDFSVGFRAQQLTFIYVEDLARAFYDALEKAPVGKTYLISEPRSYTQKEFRRIVREKLGKRLVVPVCAPLWLTKAVCAVAEKWGVMRLKPSTLNRDKFNILKQRNWRADVQAAQRDFGFSAATSLRDGVSHSIDWYKASGWLK